MHFRLRYFSRSRSAVTVLCAFFLLSVGAVAAETNTRESKPAATHAPKARKAGRVKFEKGSGETRAERNRRLQRECRGMPNAGACLGYGS